MNPGEKSTPAASSCEDVEKGPSAFPASSNKSPSHCALWTRAKKDVVAADRSINRTRDRSLSRKRTLGRRLRGENPRYTASRGKPLVPGFAHAHTGGRSTSQPVTRVSIRSASATVRPSMCALTCRKKHRARASSRSPRRPSLRIDAGTVPGKTVGESGFGCRRATTGTTSASKTTAEVPKASGRWQTEETAGSGRPTRGCRRLPWAAQIREDVSIGEGNRRTGRATV